MSCSRDICESLMSSLFLCVFITNTIFRQFEAAMCGGAVKPILRGWLVFMLCVTAITLMIPPAHGVDCSIAPDGSSVQVTLPASEFVLEDCRWLNVSLELVAQGQFAVVMRNIHMEGGSLTVRSASTTAVASTISVQNSTFVGCAECVCVKAAGQVLSLVHLTVDSSTIRATRSAVSLKGTRIEHSSITVRDSIVEAQCSGPCEVASVAAADLFNVSIFGFSSRITSASKGSPSTCTGLSFFDAASTNIVAKSIRICAWGCIITATGEHAVASMGFASYGMSNIIATDIAVCASGCVIAASGKHSIASMGFASYGDTFRTTPITATDVALNASRCLVTASGENSVASMGFASYGTALIPSINATGVAVCAHRCTVTATGTHSIASMGFTSYNNNSTSYSYSVITAARIALYALRCTITATGEHSIASMGFTSCSYRPNLNKILVFYNSVITASSVALYASGCIIAATGEHSVASMGFTAHSSDSSWISASSLEMYALRCNVTASGKCSVASMGFVAVSSSTSGYFIRDPFVNAYNVTVYASGCTVTASGEQLGVASMGFTSCADNSDSSSNINTAEGYNRTYAHIAAAEIAVYASGCTVTATGDHSIAIMGFASSATTSSVTSKNVLLGSCGSEISALGTHTVAGVGAAVATSVVQSNTRWLLLRSRMKVIGGACLPMMPSTHLPSVAVDVELTECGTVGGWSTPSPFCGSNVTLRGAPLNESVAPTNYAESLCPYSTATCDEVLSPPPLVFPFAVESSSTLTLNRTRSPEISTSQTQSSTRGRSASVPTASNASRTDSISRIPTEGSTLSPSPSLLLPPVQGSPSAARLAANIVGSEATASAIVQSGVASTLVASLVAMPSAASYASRVGSLAKVANCGFANRVEAGAIPDRSEHPFHFALGSSGLRHYAGAAVLTVLLFILLPCSLLAAMHWLLGSTPQDSHVLSTLQRHVFGVLASLCFAYFAPNVLGVSASLISFGGTDEVVAGATLGVAVIAVWCAFVAGLVCVPLRRQKGGRLVWDFRERLCVTFWIFGEAAAELSRMTSRLYYEEEVFVSGAFAALVNVPPIRDSCTPVALTVTVLALAHVMFIGLSRPYERGLDNCFSLVAAILQLLLAIVNIALVQNVGAVAEDIAGALVLSLSGLFFVQALIGAMAACMGHYCGSKKTAHDDDDDDNDEAFGVGAGLLVPVPPAATSSQPFHANPLGEASSRQEGKGRGLFASLLDIAEFI